jgi:hypothetical protein
MKHIRKFNESNEVDLTKEEKEVITKLEKLSKADDVSRSQKTLINKVISEIKEGKYKK